MKWNPVCPLKNSTLWDNKYTLEGTIWIDGFYGIHLRHIWIHDLYHIHLEHSQVHKEFLYIIHYWHEIFTYEYFDCRLKLYLHFYTYWYPIWCIQNKTVGRGEAALGLEGAAGPLGLRAPFNFFPKIQKFFKFFSYSTPLYKICIMYF